MWSIARWVIMLISSASPPSISPRSARAWVEKPPTIGYPALQPFISVVCCKREKWHLLRFPIFLISPHLPISADLCRSIWERLQPNSESSPLFSELCDKCLLTHFLLWYLCFIISYQTTDRGDFQQKVQTYNLLTWIQNEMLSQNDNLSQKTWEHRIVNYLLFD